MALCLQEQGQQSFNKQHRRLQETREAISHLQHSKRFMEFLLSLGDAGAFLPQTLGKEQASFQGEVLRHIRQVCEERIGDVREMIMQSEGYLLYDGEYESALTKQEALKQEAIKQLEMEAAKGSVNLAFAEAERMKQEQENCEKNEEDAQAMLRQIASVAEAAAAKSARAKKTAIVKQEEEEEAPFIDDAGETEERGLSQHEEEELPMEEVAEEESRERRPKKDKKKKKDKKHKKDRKKHRHAERDDEDMEEEKKDGEDRDEEDDGEKKRRRLHKIQEDEE